jgi:hypothetical protein
LVNDVRVLDACLKVNEQLRLSQFQQRIGPSNYLGFWYQLVEQVIKTQQRALLKNAVGSGREDDEGYRHPSHPHPFLLDGLLDDEKVG